MHRHARIPFRVPSVGQRSAARRGATLAFRSAVLLAGLILHSRADAQDAFADAVAEFIPGRNAGFGADQLPAVVLGPPRGAGDLQGSVDVVALGIGGSITLRFDPPVICDGPGVDFIVFENAFHSGSLSGPLFTEYGIVAVSQDGVRFVEFPFDVKSHHGLAGQRPVLSHPDNGISPMDPSVAGGDQFDLAHIGLPWAAYVRITDVGGSIPDVGDLPQFNVAPNAGLDLDALAAVHACVPGPTSSPTPTRTATPTRTPGPPLAGDLDGDGEVTAADVDLLIAELFDGDGDSAGSAAGGAVATDGNADVNDDGHITAADLAEISRLRTR